MVITRKFFLMLLLILFVGVIIFAIFEYRRVRALIDTGLGIMESTVAYEQHPENPTERVVFVGDSSAVGVGASTPEESVPGLYGADNPETDISNVAVSGAKTGDTIAQIESLPKDTTYDIMFLHMGGNDVVRLKSMKTIEENVDTALSLALQHAERVVLIHGGDIGTATLLPRGTRNMYSWRTAKLRTLYTEIARDNSQVVYADILGGITSEEYTAHSQWQRFPDDPFHNEPEQFLAADQFHPSSEGYAYWYQVITLALEQ